MSAAFRPHHAMGLHQLELPAMCRAVEDCLQRQPFHRDLDDLGGRALYLQRLGVCVLPHQAVVGGWLCTLIATRPWCGRLPTGICTVLDLDLATGLDVINPWCPHADLTAEQFLGVWLVRARQAFCGRPGTLEAALVAAADTETLQVITAHRANPGLAARAGAGRYPPAVQVGCARLVDAGFLIALGEGEPDRRYAFSIPPTVGPHS